MRLFLDICQGLGLGAAAGIRPFLPALLAGGLASANLGVDFDHTQYAFLESPAWLLAVTVALVLTFLARGVLASGPGAAALAGLAIGIGALLFAGTLADHGYWALPGLVGGAGAAALGQSSSRDLMTRTGRRLDPRARAALPVYFEAVALVLAGLSIAAPPVALLAVPFLGWLLLGGRRREDGKYAGLRILR